MAALIGADRVLGALVAQGLLAERPGPAEAHLVPYADGRIAVVVAARDRAAHGTRSTGNRYHGVHGGHWARPLGQKEGGSAGAMEEG